MSLGIIRGLPADANARPEIGRGDPRRWAATAFQALGYRPYADVPEESISTGAAKPATVGETGTGIGPRLNSFNLRYSHGYRSQIAGAPTWCAKLDWWARPDSRYMSVSMDE